MSRKQPARHNDAPESAEVRKLVDEILALSREILNQSASPKAPQLNQLIFKRGKLMEELSALNLAVLPEALRAQSLEKLEACRKMDDTILHNLESVQSGTDSQLKGFRDAKQLLGKYKMSIEESGTIRSEEA